MVNLSSSHKYDFVVFASGLGDCGDNISGQTQIILWA